MPAPTRYRALLIREDRFVYGLPLYRNGYCFIHLEDVPGMTAMVRPETVGMFTGVMVRSPESEPNTFVALFEGDVVLIERGGAEAVAAVVWTNAGMPRFELSPKRQAGEIWRIAARDEGLNGFVDDSITVIGNIHQKLYNQILKLPK